jgi:hypothetical protein
VTDQPAAHADLASAMQSALASTQKNLHAIERNGMPTDRRGKRGEPAREGPRDEQHVEALENLANDPGNVADYQSGPSSSPDASALGDSTGNARASAEVSGFRADENALADTGKAYSRNRGNRQRRDPKRRF